MREEERDFAVKKMRHLRLADKLERKILEKYQRLESEIQEWEDGTVDITIEEFMRMKRVIK